MEPISAAMAEPMRPAIRMDIITGASSLHMELPTTEPMRVARPRSASKGPVCNAITPPMNNDRMQAINKLALPISNNWSYTFRRCRQVCGSACSVRQNRTSNSPMF
jgi:hypothetical protein